MERSRHDQDVEHNHKRCFQLSRKTRLQAVIAISFCFFLGEITVGFYTKSLALVADAFHYVKLSPMPPYSCLSASSHLHR